MVWALRLLVCKPFALATLNWYIYTSVLCVILENFPLIAEVDYLLLKFYLSEPCHIFQSPAIGGYISAYTDKNSSSCIIIDLSTLCKIKFYLNLKISYEK